MTTFRRTFHIRAGEDTESGNIRVALSSEQPYPRRHLNGHSMAMEVLGHQSDEVDLSRLSNAAPFLVNHDTNDQVGVLEDVSLDADGIIRADVRFSRSARGQEIEQDIRDGIRQKVSVGYEVTDWKDTGEQVDGYPVVRAVRWVPTEASSVPIAADDTVGVGRSKDINDKQGATPPMKNEFRQKLLNALRAIEEEKESKEEMEVAKAVDELKDAVEALAKVTDEHPEDEREEEEDEREEDEEEREEEEEEREDEDEKGDDDDYKASKSHNKGATRMAKQTNGSTGASNPAELAKIARTYGRTADLPSWIEQGRNSSDVLEEILDSRSTAHRLGAPDLSEREMKEFSFAKAIRSHLRGDNSLAAEIGAEKAMKRLGSEYNSNALYLPLTHPASRTLTSVDGNSGDAFNVPKYLSFEEILREETILGQLGVEVREERAELQMPRSDGISAAWVDETDPVPEASGSYETIRWKMHALAVDVPMTAQIATLDDIYNVEDIVVQDIFGALAEGFEEAVFTGDGASAPQGLLNDPTIPVVPGDPAFDFEAFTDFSRIQAENKGRRTNLHYALAPALYQAAQINPKFAESGVGVAGPMILENGAIDGYPVVRSNFLRTASENGAIFGSFGRVLAVHFGVLQLQKNPYRRSQNRITMLEGTLFGDSHARQAKDLVRLPDWDDDNGGD